MSIKSEGSAVTTTDGPAKSSFKHRVLRILGAMLWAIRPRLPMAVVRPLMNRKINRAVNDPAAMEAARRQMTHMLSFANQCDSVDVDSIYGDLDSVAKDFIAHSAWWSELRWHPRENTKQRIIGLDNLERAHSEGRGVILSFVHHAQFGGIFKSIARYGYRVDAVAAASAMQSPGPNTMQYLRVVGSGGKLISSDTGMSGIQEALGKGHIVAAAVDPPGRTVVNFAGRKVRCSAGGAVAAARSGAPIVVATSFADGDSTVVHLSEPIHPADFDSIDAVAQELIRQQEIPVLSWVSATYLPEISWTLADD